MKINYDLKLKTLLSKLDKKYKLLIHACCGPCSSYVLEYLKDYFDITILYYNPNIEPFEEYLKRKEEQKRLCEILGVNIMDCDYDNDLFHEVVKGLEDVPEGGARCFKCYELRMRKTAELSKDFDYFGTTLTISPLKNSKKINEIGIMLESEYNTKYLLSN